MSRATVWVARGVTWPLLPVLLAFLSYDDLTAAAAPYVVALLATWSVGILLTARVPDRPAGWAFLGLGTSVAWSAFTEQLALDHHSRWLAALSASSWVWWFVFVALALALTPPAPARARRLAAVTLALGAVSQALMLVEDRALEAPFEDVLPPGADGPLGGPAAVAVPILLVALGLCVLAAVGVLLRAFRRSRGEERQQLLWLVAGVLPLVPCTLAAYAFSYAGSEQAAGWAMTLALVTTAGGAALSVLRYRLYDVERVVTDSAAYALASGAVIVAFGLVVVVIGRTTPLGETSQLPTVIATLIGVVVARQSYVWARRAVDRRINRPRFDAVEAVRVGLAAEPPHDLDAVLAAALRDPGARVLYPGGDQSWVTADGRAVSPGDHVVDVRGAKVEYDPRAVDGGVVAAAAAAAAAEIDNVALRAELARQVDVVTQSRARLATAHLDERRRIERDLHDGAQQRILAIALQLQSARLSGADDLLRDEVDRAVAHLGLTVQELRDLASGLQPSALATGGLLAAVEDLAERLPLTVGYDVPDRRYDAAAETAAWFVIAEAVANAVKHAAADSLRIEVSDGGPNIVVSVSDSGRGGADPRGAGLQGLRDRVAALGGTLDVSERAPRGTTVTAVVPCAS